MLEYEQLKEEQRQRIASRDNLVYATLVAVGAVGAAALQASSLMLLLLPPVCVILGWTHATNDRKVWEIGRYLRRTLAVQLAAEPLRLPFAWETVHRTGDGYRRRQAVQSAVTLLTFCGPGFVAIGVNVAAAGSSAMIAVVVVAETVAMAALAYVVLTNVDRQPDDETPARG